jgi:cytochrome c oxidase accessory protein FixG
VYLEGVFRRVERWIEGKPAKRKQLDAGERDDSYWTKKITKHLIYWGMSTALALSFTAYFIGPEASYAMFYNFGQEGHRTAMIVAVVTTLLVYLDFAWFREQFCHFLCPYARIQSVFLDDDSLIIGYDPIRGEPRGQFRPKETRTLGDCIDCKRCVQVCPAGIDIRDGLQLECVQCTACIDACDHVMERINKPHGLIRYDSVSGIEHRKRRIARPRVIIYSVVLVALIGLLGVKLAGRAPVTLSVVRQPGTPYVVQEDNRVRNILQLNLTNTLGDAQVVDVRMTGIDGAEVTVPGAPFTLQPGERISSPAFVMVPKESITQSSTQITMQLVQDGNVITEQDAKFLGPIYRGK